MPLHTDLVEYVQNSDHGDPDERFFGMEGKDLPSFLVETDPGDLLIFNHSLYHSVYAENGRRSFLSFKYAARPRCDAHLLSLQRSASYIFSPHANWQNSSSARIRGMVEGVEDLGRKAEALTAIRNEG